MTMEKILFNSKKELVEWLYTGYIKLGAFKDYHVTNLAHDMGVYFYTKIEAGLTEVDDGSFAGAEHYTINKNGHFPEKYPVVLVLHKTTNHKENQYDYYFEFVYLTDFKEARREEMVRVIGKLKTLSNLDNCTSAGDMQDALEEINDLLNEQCPWD